MNTKLLLAATLLAALPVASFAADNNSTYSRRTNTTTTTTRTYPVERTWHGLVGPYVSAFGGWNKLQDEGGFDFDDGYVAGAAIGGKTKWARAELEGSFRENDLEGVAAGGQVKQTAIMLNAYWDIETGTRFTPYLGAGLGTAYVDVDTTGGDDNWEFAYQGMAGANFAIDPRWTVGAEYRYFGTTEVGSTDINNHAVLGNVRYAF